MPIPLTEFFLLNVWAIIVYMLASQLHISENISFVLFLLTVINI